MDIKVKYHTDIVKPIAQAHTGEWCDLKAAQEYNLTEGFYMIDLGISIQLPKGYEAIIAPRSSTFKKFGIIQTNGIGIIDETYCGENDIWKMPVFATRPTTIPAGERICQFRIQPIQGELNIIEVEQMNNENRGGFGSTDLNK